MVLVREQQGIDLKYFFIYILTHVLIFITILLIIDK